MEIDYGKVIGYAALGIGAYIILQMLLPYLVLAVIGASALYLYNQRKK